MLCPPGLGNNPNRDLQSIGFVTIHCTGNYNATAGARNHALYQYRGSGGGAVSWHYTVDTDEIWQSFLDTQACWHAGDGTAGPGNSSSIGIEIAVSSRTGFPQACRNAAWLTAELLTRYGLTADRVVQHNRWNGKNCPLELRNGTWGVAWGDFLDMVREYVTPVPLTRDDYRAVIQGKCHFSDPEGVWRVLDTHPYADDLYRKLAQAMQ